MSWAVTAWPPVGGLGGRIAHKHPHTPSTSTNAHIRRLVSTRTWTHAQKPTHYLNSLDLTLLTTHLPDNSHSDFLRDEKCFRATRRLVLFFLFFWFFGNPRFFGTTKFPNLWKMVFFGISEYSKHLVLSEMSLSVAKVLEKNICKSLENRTLRDTRSVF